MRIKERQKATSFRNKLMGKKSGTQWRCFEAIATGKDPMKIKGLNSYEERALGTTVASLHRNGICDLAGTELTTLGEKLWDQYKTKHNL